MSDELISLAHDSIEIPVYQRPFSYNVAAAAAMAMYEVRLGYHRGVFPTSKAYTYCSA